MPLAPSVPATWRGGETTSATKFNSNIRDAIGFLAGKIVLRAEDRVGTQSIPNATNTVMVLGTVIEDPYSAWVTGANNRFVAPNDGIYLVVVTVCMTGGTGAGNTQYAALDYNSGANFYAGAQYLIASTTPQGVQVASPIILRAGDAVGPACWQNSGAARTLSFTSTGLTSAIEIMWVSK